MTNESGKKKIEKMLYTHGTLSILFYKMNGFYIIHKFGVYESLESEYEKLFKRFKKAGFEEAETVTLMDLPRNVEEIFEIIYCGGLEYFLKKNKIA